MLNRDAKPHDELLQQFVDQVQQHPGKTAFVYRGISLTYKEFNEKINQLSHYLLQHEPHLFGAEKNPFIGVIGNDKLSLLIFQLAILKLGGAYVPFDAMSPNERTVFMLKNAKTTLLLCDNYMKLPSNTRELLESCQVRLLDYAKPEIQSAIKKADLQDIYLPCNSHQPAYLLYTSGSTANQPKGVIQTRFGVHGQIKNYTHDLQITDKDSLLQLAVFTHDQAVVDYFAALLNGCTLCLYDVHNLEVTDLHRFMKQNQVSIFSAIPSMFTMVFENINNNNEFPALRIVTIGGEETKLNHAELYDKTCPPHCVLINGYGATECSWALSFTVDHKTNLAQFNSFPLGHPTKGLKIFLDTSISDLGDTAELCIHSDYLSPGYWNNQEATDKSFIKMGNDVYYRTGDMVKQRPDQTYEFVGRTHWLGKIHGKIVNLHEIEDVLQTKYSLDEVAVMFYGEKEFKKIYAFLAKKKRSSQLNNRVIHKEMRMTSSLPDHMLPARYFIEDELPKLPNKKVDKNKLKSTLEPLGTICKKLSKEELHQLPFLEMVKQVWCQELQLDKNDKNITDGDLEFEELGGNSQDALRIKNIINRYFEEKYQLESLISVLNIYQNPTLHELIDTITIKIERDLQIGYDITNIAEPMASFVPRWKNMRDDAPPYINSQYQSINLNYEAVSLLAKMANQQHGILIKPTMTHDDTIEAIDAELNRTDGPSQSGFMILQEDHKNAHPTPCILHINKETKEKTLLLADTVGHSNAKILQHPVIAEIRKRHPDVKIGLDLSWRQDDEVSCAVDLIHYFSEGLRLNMMDCITRTKEYSDHFEFISPPEVFKVTQKKLPEGLNQDRPLNGDPKKRTLRQFIADNTEACIYTTTNKLNDKIGLMSHAENTYMFKYGCQLKQQIESATQKNIMQFSMFKPKPTFRTETICLTTPSGKTATLEITIDVKLENNKFDDIKRDIVRALGLPTDKGIDYQLSFSGRNIDSIQEVSLMMTLMNGKQNQTERTLEVIFNEPKPGPECSIL